MQEAVAHVSIKEVEAGEQVMKRLQLAALNLNKSIKKIKNKKFKCFVNITRMHKIQLFSKHSQEPFIEFLKKSSTNHQKINNVGKVKVGGQD